MSAARTSPTARLDAELDGLVERGIVPGGVAVVATPRRVLHERAFGCRSLAPEREPATPDTIYDLASVTKALVVGVLALRLRARGELDFAQPVTELVPEMGEGGVDAPRVPTIGELLSHASGLPAWRPLYAVAGTDLAARAEWLARHRTAPGKAAVYGCPGYQVLGLALERAGRRPLAELAADLIGSDGMHVLPPAELASRCAPTEDGNAFERRIAGSDGASYGGWRTGVIRGVVHDHNAFTAGGFAGNAGLFGVASAVARFAARLIEPGDLLTARDVAELSEDQTGGIPGERRTWGFQLASSQGSPAGPALSPRSFGHVGFTGTSVFINPERRAAYVLLTNRVHPAHVEHAFNADRRAFHSAAAAVASSFE